MAERVMTVFVDHDRPYAAWWADVSPFLDSEAVYSYEYTDPALIVGSRVTGAGRLSKGDSATAVSVLVPTDAGQYRVDLIRQVDDGSTDAPWQVHYIAPPEGTS